MRRMALVAGSAAVMAALVAPATGAQEVDLVDAAVGHVLRTVCDYQWIDGVCEQTGYPDPQYRTDVDPSPGAPLVQVVGAVHEHSAYSDGRWNSRPADYYEAARTGHNRADDGRDTGIALDFMISSEHSDNERLPVTTSYDCIDVSVIPDGLAALELTGILPPLRCAHVLEGDHYAKWTANLAQAVEATEVSPEGEFIGFTAMRGFEWTNDYYNHMNVFFSRNTTNAKIDGALLTMDAMWNWLREPAERGGGDDALVTFNHPGSLPHLTPFDDGLPHGHLLQALLGGANWNDVAYVPDVDDNVVGLEVNGGDDLSWYVRALTNGWHLGPVGAEDVHTEEWASRGDPKTLVLVGGRSPRDYYYAFRHHRTAAIAADTLVGVPGERGIVPTVQLWAGDVPMGAQLSGVASLDLRVDLRDLPADSPVVLVTNQQASPIPVGAVGDDGALDATVTVTPPAGDEGWWFVVACRTTSTACGQDEAYLAVTAPIWATADEAAPSAEATPAGVDAAAAPAAGGSAEAGEATPAAAGASAPSTPGSASPALAASSSSAPATSALATTGALPPAAPLAVAAALALGCARATRRRLRA